MHLSEQVVSFGTQGDSAIPNVYYIAKKDACLENKTSTGANTFVLCRDRASVESFPAISRKCCVFHVTTHPSSTVQYWIEQVNVYLTAKFIGHKRFKGMTLCVNQIFLRIQAKGLQVSNYFNECKDLCCEMQSDF